MKYLREKKCWLTFGTLVYISKTVLTGQYQVIVGVVYFWSGILSSRWLNESYTY